MQYIYRKKVLHVSKYMEKVSKMHQKYGYQRGGGSRISKKTFPDRKNFVV